MRFGDKRNNFKGKQQLDSRSSFIPRILANHISPLHMRLPGDIDYPKRTQPHLIMYIQLGLIKISQVWLG